MFSALKKIVNTVTNNPAQHLYKPTNFQAPQFQFQKVCIRMMTLHTLLFIYSSNQHNLHLPSEHALTLSLQSVVQLSHHGVPAGATTIAHDPIQKLLAIGTYTGTIKMYVQTTLTLYM
jgi:hypothetical protein